MAMTHIAPALDPSSVEAASASAEVAAVAHTTLVNNPKYNLILNGIGVGTVASTIAIKFWIYAVFLSRSSQCRYRTVLRRSMTATSYTQMLFTIEQMRCRRLSRLLDFVVEYMMLLSLIVVREYAMAGPGGWCDGGIHHFEGRMGHLPRCDARGTGCRDKVQGGP